MGVWTGLCRHLPENTDSGFPNTTEQRPQTSTTEIKELQWPSATITKKNKLKFKKLKL